MKPNFDLYPRSARTSLLPVRAPTRIHFEKEEAA